MNIIKHGKFYHEITCPNCGCVFGYIDGRFKSDVEVRHLNGDMSKEDTIVICPECIEFIPVEKKLIK